MVKKKISNVRAALKFGFLGAFILLCFTLFWPSIYFVTITVNTLIGYVGAFIINLIFRTIKYGR